MLYHLNLSSAYIGGEELLTFCHIIGTQMKTGCQCFEVQGDRRGMKTVKRIQPNVFASTACVTGIKQD